MKTKNQTKSRTQQLTEYTAIGSNIYATKTSTGANRYRVRAYVDGVKYDQTFTNKKIAMAYRSELRKMRQN
jgi:hypothetical protein